MNHERKRHRILHDMIAEGYTGAEIAAKLGVSEQRVSFMKKQGFEMVEDDRRIEVLQEFAAFGEDARRALEPRRP